MRIRASGWRRASLGALQALLLLYAVSLLFPFVWMLLNSFKTNPEFFQSIWSIPKALQFENYRAAWLENGIGSFFLNSVKLTVLGTFLSVMNAATPAYVVARYEFRFKSLIYGMAVAGMLIPNVGAISALYRFMTGTRLFDTHIGLLLLYSGGLGFGFILLHAFFKGISWSYAEAAFVDGASDFTVFLRVMLPQAKPGIAAVALVTAIGLWNDFYLPFMFLSSRSRFTVAVGLQALVVQQQYAADWTRLFAAMTIATLPVVVFYLMFQKKLISGMVAGGLKG